MVCPYCSHETRVSNSRPQKRTNGIWRRRACINCGAVFSSTEQIDFEKSIVVSMNNAYTPFLRDKLFLSVYESLKHRKTALRDATALTYTIISHVLIHVNDGVVSGDDIGRTSVDVLNRFDKTAATYFTAYHPYQT